MSRRREHDDALAERLLDAAEQRVAAEGIGALSLRVVAADASTTTRAVYTLFGSKDALIGELGVRAMHLLQGEVSSLPSYGNPVEDVVEAALAYRRFALEHPALYAIAFHTVDARSSLRFREAATNAFEALLLRLEPLESSSGLGDRTTREAAVQFDALCEGLAWTELRGNKLTPEPEAFWRSAVGALVRGFGTGG